MAISTPVGRGRDWDCAAVGAARARDRCAAACGCAIRLPRDTRDSASGGSVPLKTTAVRITDGGAASGREPRCWTRRW